MGIAVGADQPDHGANVGVEGGHAVSDLGAGDDHERARIVIEAAVADVADDADDLAGGLSELGADAFADEELLANGIAFGPVFFLHGLVDENDAGGGTGVLLGEVAAAQDGNVEDGEVAGGSAHPAGAAVPWRFAVGGAADDVEGQAVAAFERKAAGEGGDFDAGDGIEALAAIVGDLGDAGGLFELVAGEGHFESEDVAGIEAGVDLAESNEGADEECGSDEENESERDFADDKQGAGLALAEAGAGAVAAFLKGGVEVGARGADGGEESEENAGEEGDAEGESEDAPVDTDGGSMFADAGKAGGADGEQGANAGVAEDEAEDAAGEGEDDAFGQQLTDDARAARAHGGANGEFTLAAGGADKQKVGDVGAGDEENEADGAEKDEEGFARAGDDRVAQRLDAEAVFGVHIVGMKAAVLVGDQFELGVGLGEGNARFEAAGDKEIVAEVGLDAYSRRVIGWELSRTLHAGLAVRALQMALRGRSWKAEGLIHHSDRGIQYASSEYTELLDKGEIQISMSRRGNPYDNARAERFMRTLKEEEVYGTDYRDLEDARSRIGEFLEQTYNRQRLHSALRYLTPEEFEQASIAKESDGTDGSGGKPKAGLPPLPQALEIPPGFPHSRGSATAQSIKRNKTGRSVTN